MAAALARRNWRSSLHRALKPPGNSQQPLQLDAAGARGTERRLAKGWALDWLRLALQGRGVDGSVRGQKTARLRKVNKTLRKPVPPRLLPLPALTMASKTCLAPLLLLLLLRRFLQYPHLH